MFSPSGALFVSGSLDGSVRLWGVQSVTRANTTARKSKPSKKRDRLVVQATRPKFGRSGATPGYWTYVSEVIDAGSLYDDGWVETGEEGLLFWLPPELRDDFPIAYEASFEDAGGPISVDYSDMLLGEDWSNCYVGS